MQIPAYSLSISNNAIKTMNQINFNFIWGRRVHYVKKAELVKEYQDGGLQAIDFENGALKVKWLKSFLMNSNSLWFCIPRAIFKKLGGIDLLLKCDFSIQKLPVKLSSFH